MSIPNVNVVENNNNCSCPPGSIITSKTPSDFCCKKNCSNCNVKENMKCRIAMAKKICRPQNYKNGIQRLGQYPWMVHNLQWGNFPDHLKCFCQTCDKSVKSCCNCNCACNKLSKKIKQKMKNNIGYFKVYNRYQDYTYNTVDGWPPTMATSTTDTQHGHGMSDYVHLVHDLKKKVTGYQKILSNGQLYQYKGQLYSEHVKVPVYDSICNKTVMVKVPCARGAIKHVPRSGLNVNAFDST
jgi:hypothetical protein